MVSIEELLNKVQQAETETDRQWLLLELQMSQMPCELVSLLWAAAIPHFFDLDILTTLRPELSGQIKILYEILKSLTFIEEFSDGKYNVHELTRNVLLKQLWQNNQAEFRELSQRAADYFFEAGTLSLIEVEFCYHEIINEDHRQTGRLIDQITNWWDHYHIDRLRLLVKTISELENIERFSIFGQAFLLHLHGLLAIFAVKYKDAESFLLQAQNLYKSIEIKNPRYITTLLRDIGSNKEKMGDYREAVIFCEKALTISEEQLGKEDIDTATSLNNLAGLYFGQGRYQEAETLYLRSLHISQKQLGEEHIDTATTLNNLAGLYKSQERYKEAETLYLKSLQICQKELGENHPNTATSLNNLAGLYKSQGKYQKAEPLYLQSLQIRQEQLGENHPNLASSLNNLAGLYENQGKDKEAEPLYLQSLQIAQKQLRENHPDTAASLNNLAGLYKIQKREEEAEALYLQSLQICQKKLGENHPNTATTLDNLARLYQKQERYLDAIPLLERWKKIKQERKETRNTSYADRIRTLGTAYEKSQQFDEALTTYEEAISIFERVLPAKHPRTLVLKGELKRLKKRLKKQQKY